MKPLLTTALLISLGTLAMPGWAKCVSGNCYNGYGAWEYLGHRYEGDWVDGNRTGKGVWTWGTGEWEGSRYEGDWVLGKRTGKGVLTWPSGDRYEGDFVNGKRTGKGVKTYASGTVKSGIWEDGEFVGTVEEAAEQKAADDRIYRACLLDKSRGQDMSYAPVRQAVESTCEEISKNPSWLDKLEY